MIKLILPIIGLLSVATAVNAQTNATATFDFTQNGSLYTYNITLNDIGTTHIGTFWFAWVPGQDYLAVAPSATTCPAGW